MIPTSPPAPSRGVLSLLNCVCPGGKLSRQAILLRSSGSKGADNVPISFRTSAPLGVSPPIVLVIVAVDSFPFAHVALAVMVSSPPNMPPKLGVKASPSPVTSSLSNGGIEEQLPRALYLIFAVQLTVAPSVTLAVAVISAIFGVSSMFRVWGSSISIVGVTSILQSTRAGYGLVEGSLGSLLRQLG